MVAPFAVLTWNIQGGNQSGPHAYKLRAERIGAVLSHEEPDIFGLQEVVTENLPMIQQSLPKHTLLEGKVIDEKREKKESLPIGFNRRFNLVTNGTMWLSPAPDIPSRGWDAKYIRGCSTAILHDQATSRWVVFLTTHFDHLGEYARERSAQLIVDFLEGFKPDQPLILVGDLNCGPWRPRPDSPFRQRPYEILLGAGFIDAYRTSNSHWPPPYTFHGYKGEDYAADPDPYGWMIDFILVRNLRVLDAAIIDSDPDASDHYAVTASLDYITEL